jgi:hypothetical protein
MGGMPGPVVVSGPEAGAGPRSADNALAHAAAPRPRARRVLPVAVAVGVVCAAVAAVTSMALFAGDGAASSAGLSAGETSVPGGLRALDKIHPPWYSSAAPVEGQVWVRRVDDALIVRIEPSGQGGSVVLATVFLDLDHNRETGFSNTQSAYNMPRLGTDCWLQVEADAASGRLTGVPTLWSGCSSDGPATCRSLVHRLAASEFTPAGSGGWELRVPLQKVAAAGNVSAASIGDMGVSLRLQFASGGRAGVLNLYPNFLQDQYPAYGDAGALPACAAPPSSRAALLFSAETQAQFYSDKAYAQLYMSMQSQLRQAGLPFDRVQVRELLDVASACRYGLLVVPYLSHVAAGDMWALRKALFLLTQRYGVGLVVAGDLATHEVAAGSDAYAAMRSALALQPGSPSYASGAGETRYVVTTAGASHPALPRTLPAGAALPAPSFVQFFEPVPGSSLDVAVLVEVEAMLQPGQPALRRGALHAMQLPAARSPFALDGGRLVHVSDLDLLANAGDLAWRAMRWAARSELPRGSPGASLQLSRQPALLALRADMDGDADKADAFVGLGLNQWHFLYNAVATLYVGVGGAVEGGAGAGAAAVDWAALRSAATYNFSRSNLESELGSLPLQAVNGLAEAAVASAYAKTIAWLEGNLTLAVTGPETGVAQARDEPETLGAFRAVDRLLQGRHFSGSYSAPGNGYANALGYVDLASDTLYLAPNLLPDSTASAALWLAQYGNLTAAAATAVLHCAVRDSLFREKGPAVEDLLKHAFEAGAEFVTDRELRDRLRAFPKVTLAVRPLAGQPDALSVAAAAAPGETLGRMAVMVHQDEAPAPALIAGADGWFAYSDSRLFLPRTGGQFTLRLAAAPPADRPTHIAKLDMRVELVNVTGDGDQLAFTVQGRGAVGLQLRPRLCAQGLYVWPAPSSKIDIALACDSSNSEAVVTFASAGSHSFILSVRAAPSNPTPSPSFLTLSPTTSPAVLPAPTAAPAQPPTTRSPTEPTPNPVPPAMSTTGAPTAQPSSAQPSTAAPSALMTSAPSVAKGSAGAIVGALLAVAALGGAGFYLVRRRLAAADGGAQLQPAQTA